METVKKEAFMVIGIKVKTSNENGQVAKDIVELWERFMSQKTAEHIPNKMDPSILSIYTNYEGDHTKPYDAILGCMVNSLDDIPDGMIGQQFDGGNFAKFAAKGDLTKNAVSDAWLEIWKQDLNRTYTADFEVYGEKAQDPTNGEAEIFVAVQ